MALRSNRLGGILAGLVVVGLGGCYPYLTAPAPLVQFEEAGDVFVAAGASGSGRTCRFPTSTA